MIFVIEGTLYPILSIDLDKGEQIYTQTHSILSLTKNAEMKTEMYGGLIKAVRRLAGGDSMFLATVTAHEDNQNLKISDDVCGNMLALPIDGDHSYLCDRSAYLCSQPTVDLDVAFMRKIRMGLFGGEGFVLERLSGTGWAFLHGYGEIQKTVLKEGDILKVTSGRVMAISTTVEMDIEFVKTFNNILFSGRGLFVTTLTGHGDVYLQSFTKKSRKLDL